MKPEGIFLIWIVVKDLDKAIKYYTEVLGLKVEQYSKEYGWAELAGPLGAILGLAQESAQMDIKAGSNAVVSVTVKNLIEAKKEMAKKGARFMGEIVEVPGHVKMQTCVDPDGNTLQVVEVIEEEK